MCSNNIFPWAEETAFRYTFIFSRMWCRRFVFMSGQKSVCQAKTREGSLCEDPYHRSQGYNSSEELQKCYTIVENRVWNFLFCCCCVSWLGYLCNLTSLEHCGNVPSVSISLDNLKSINHRSL